MLRTRRCSCWQFGGFLLTQSPQIRMQLLTANGKLQLLRAKAGKLRQTKLFQA